MIHVSVLFLKKCPNISLLLLFITTQLMCLFIYRPLERQPATVWSTVMVSNDCNALNQLQGILVETWVDTEYSHCALFIILKNDIIVTSLCLINSKHLCYQCAHSFRVNKNTYWQNICYPLLVVNKLELTVVMYVALALCATLIILNSS